MAAEDGGPGKLQTHKPVGFLQTVNFSMDATAPRNWLGILTQRRVVHSGCFLKTWAGFPTLPSTVELWLGMHQGGPGGQSSSSLDCNRTLVTP